MTSNVVCTWRLDETFPLNQIEQLYTAIAPHYEQANQSERLRLQTFEHLRHQLDLEAAKNSPELQQVVAAWFSQHL